MNPPNSSLANESRRLPVVAIILVVGAGILVLSQWGKRNLNAHRGTGHPIVGRTLPSLQLQPLTGGDQPRGVADLQGKVTLINYWGTWCMPCREEFPHIASMAQRYSTHAQFQLFSVACPWSADQSVESLQEETLQHLKKHQVDFPTYYAMNDTNMSLALMLETSGIGIPMTFVIDQQGIIRGYWEGYQSGDEIAVERLVRELLDS